MYLNRLSNIVTFCGKCSGYIVTGFTGLLVIVIVWSIYNYSGVVSLEQDSYNFSKLISIRDDVKKSQWYFKQISPNSIYYQLAEILIADNNDSNSAQIHAYQVLAQTTSYVPLKQLASFYIDYFNSIKNMSITGLLDTTMPYYTDPTLSLLMKEKLVNFYFKINDYVQLELLFKSIDLSQDNFIVQRLRSLKNIISFDSQ